ncbi:PIG-M-domain-containing protein [Morchella snyderi]|nr:PIG-M-domain-containing protein [Morchella snyderi]
MFNLRNVLLASAALRAGMFFYGLYQDAHSALKYTDIDYYVFTDASRCVAMGQSPYDRETYRYTPLLAWLLLPTAVQPQWFWFSFGKVLFAVGDLIAGWLIYSVLRTSYGGMDKGRALKFASIWLLNPMVATISTRGSSEGLLGVMVVGLVWAAMKRKAMTTGVLLGLAVHFKIYPVVYGPAILWWMEDRKMGQTITQKTFGFFTVSRIKFSLSALVTFIGLNLAMWKIYRDPFIIHTYLHHVERLDHRHNFSPYNILLYLTSPPSMGDPSFPYASVAFLPQLFLSGVLLPLAFAKWDLPTTLFAQTFAFVAFNKVCTSQYFMWYIVLLPFYLHTSSLLRSPKLGFSALGAWVLTQASWLQQGYELEFLGHSTFFPGLWGSALAFFVVNCWLLGVIVGDIKDRRVISGKKLN